MSWLIQENNIHSISVDHVAGRTGSLLWAAPVPVAGLMAEVEVLLPEACLRMMTVETNAAHLMAPETNSMAEEACGRLQLMLVNRH